MIQDCPTAVEIHSGTLILGRGRCLDCVWTSPFPIRRSAAQTSPGSRVPGITKMTGILGDSQCTKWGGGLRPCQSCVPSYNNTICCTSVLRTKFYTWLAFSHKRSQKMAPLKCDYVSTVLSKHEYSQQSKQSTYSPHALDNNNSPWGTGSTSGLSSRADVCSNSITSYIFKEIIETKDKKQEFLSKAEQTWAWEHTTTWPAMWRQMWLHDCTFQSK